MDLYAYLLPCSTFYISLFHREPAVIYLPTLTVVKATHCYWEGHGWSNCSKVVIGTNLPGCLRITCACSLSNTNPSPLSTLVGQKVIWKQEDKHEKQMETISKVGSFQQGVTLFPNKGMNSAIPLDDAGFWESCKCFFSSLKAAFQEISFHFQVSCWLHKHWSGSGCVAVMSTNEVLQEESGYSLSKHVHKLRLSEWLSQHLKMSLESLLMLLWGTAFAIAGCT